MKVKITTKGISIDASSNQDMIDTLGAEKAVMLVNNILSLRIDNESEMFGRSLHLVTIDHEEYFFIPYFISEINGSTVGFETLEKLYNVVSESLLVV